MSSFDFPIVLIKNLPFNISASSLYELLGKYGNIHQLRVPDNSKDAQPGTCIVIYSNMDSAQKALKELNGINLHGRYIVANLYGVEKSKLTHEDFIYRKEELEKLKQQYGIE